MTVVLPTGVHGGGAAAVAALSHTGCSRGYRHRCGNDRGGRGPVAVTPAVVGARGGHGVHRADAGA